MINTNSITGVNTFNVDQGNDEWRKHRAGVITASNAHLVIKNEKKNGDMPDMKNGYLNQLIGQVCTGLVPESASFKQAEWGHMNEELARDAYEARNLSIITQAGLIYKDESMRCAISPDGLDMDSNEGLEIKSPFTTQVHIDTLLNGKIKPEYIVQCQYSMWVTGWDTWNFCSYDNRMRGKIENRLFVIPINRDEEMMNIFDKKVPEFIRKMDEALSDLGFEFGDQWR